MLDAMLVVELDIMLASLDAMATPQAHESNRLVGWLGKGPILREPTERMTLNGQAGLRVGRGPRPLVI